MSDLLKRGILNSLGIAAYIVLVALIIRFGESFFPDDNILTIIGMLTLMTVSAAIVGSLIFVKPVMLYLDGLKKDAIWLLLYTIGSLAVLLVIYLIVLAVL